MIQAKQPRKYDAILGSQTSLQQAQQRILQLENQLRHVQRQIGTDGLDLLIEAMNASESKTVQRVALSLLQDSASPKAINALEEFKPDSYKLISCLHTGRHEDWVHSVAFSLDGQTLVSSGGDQDRTIKIWNLDNGSLIRTLIGHQRWISSVAVSPNGQILASGSADKTIKIWDFNTGNLINDIADPDEVWSVAFSPDNQTLTSGSKDKTIKLWDFQAGVLIGVFAGFADVVRSVAISPDGQILAGGSNDNTIRIWNLGTRKLLYQFREHTNHVRSIAISPDSQTLISGGHDKTIKIWHLGTGNLIHSLDDTASVPSVVVSADGRFIVSSNDDGKVKIWHLDTGQLIHTINAHSTYALSAAISSDGWTLASGSAHKTAKVWRVSP